MLKKVNHFAEILQPTERIIEAALLYENPHREAHACPTLCLYNFDCIKSSFYYILQIDHLSRCSPLVEAWVLTFSEEALAIESEHLVFHYDNRPIIR